MPLNLTTALADLRGDPRRLTQNMLQIVGVPVAGRWEMHGQKKRRLNHAILAVDRSSETP